MTSTVIPCLRYRDAPRMIEWLCDTFGFERKLTVPDEEGGIVHAELAFGGGMIMLGSVRKAESEWGRQIRQPDETGGTETQSPYLVVADIDGIYARAKAGGAEIIRELKATGHGSREFICRDPEGHLWSLGTYDPWKAQG